MVEALAVGFDVGDEYVAEVVVKLSTNTSQSFRFVWAYAGP
jgi:hypothetical protein